MPRSVVSFHTQSLRENSGVNDALQRLYTGDGASTPLSCAVRGHARVTNEDRPAHCKSQAYAVSCLLSVTSVNLPSKSPPFLYNR
jgi:hypothetical protein